MRDQDKHRFAEVYRGVCATYGREASKDAMRIAWAALCGHDIAAVASAYTTHLMHSRYMPTPADILDRLNAQSPGQQRPGADEAWAMLPRSEDDSVVWTDEMATAWAVASPLVNPCLVDRPDWVAARMAFRDAYNRAIETAQAQHRPVRWSLCRGQKTDNLDEVLREAERLGRMTHEDVARHAMTHEHQQPMDVARLVHQSAPNKDAALAFVRKMRELLTPDTTLMEQSREEARRYCEARDAEHEHAKAQPSSEGDFLP